MDALIELKRQYIAKFGSDPDVLWLARTKGPEEAEALLRRAIATGNPLPPPQYGDALL